MSGNDRLIVINIPKHWMPGRDSFVKLQLNPCVRYQFEHMISYAEIAASVIVWHAQIKEGFEPITYRELNKLKSPQIMIVNPYGESYTATRLMAGIRVLIDIGLVKNDKQNEQIIIKEEILDRICITDLRQSSAPCA